MRGDQDVAKTLAEQHKEVDAQMQLAKAVGVDPAEVSYETGRSLNTIHVGQVVISWHQDGQGHFDALIEVVKLGLEAKKKPQPAVVSGAAQKTA